MLLRDIQRAAIPGVVKLQEELGFKAVTDGEYNRGGWQRDFLLSFENVAMTESKVPVRFHTAEGVVLQQPPAMQITGKLARVRPIFVDDFKFLKTLVSPGITPKITIPSPTILHFRGGRDAISRTAYPTLDSFYAISRASIAKRSPILPPRAAAICRSTRRTSPTCAIRRCATTPAASAKTRTRCCARMPMCSTMSSRASPTTWSCASIFAGQLRRRLGRRRRYEPVAKVLLQDIKADGYFMEYDSDRAGGFEPLRHLPAGKTVVLGLITSKNGALESKDAIKRRIEEAAKVVPLDQLALSPQCGFASGIEGMAMSIEQQVAKLKLVVETARDVWGA